MKHDVTNVCNPSQTTYELVQIPGSSVTSKQIGWWSAVSTPLTKYVSGYSSEYGT